MQNQTAGSARTDEPALHVEGVSKTFGGFRALDSVSLTVAQGEVHALLGENGSGKSTLIKILSGYHDPDPGGTITVSGSSLATGDAAASHEAGLRFVHQNLGLIESCSVADNLSFTTGFPTRNWTVSQKRLRAQALEALQRLGLDLDPEALVGSLSQAERTGVAVARALQARNEERISLLVLDEPTATLPENEVERLVGLVKAIASGGTGVLYVTHRLEEVFTTASVATVLRDGVEVVTRPVAGLTRPKLIEYLVGDALEASREESASLHVDSSRSALEARAVKTSQIDEVSLTLRPGEVVGVAGITGSGREQLCGALFGAIKRDSGDVLIAGKAMPTNDPCACIEVGTAFIPANRQRDGGFMDLSARENFAISDLEPFWRRFRLNRALEDRETSRWFEKVNVRPTGANEQRLGAFSGGNQQKVIFAKWLRRDPHLFLLDEPTQGVDVATKAFLHHQLLQAARAGAAVLVSSSDVDELVALCQRVIVLRQGRVVADLVGQANSASNISREALGVDEMSVA